MVQGPSGTPTGTGSAELATLSASDGIALILADYKGVRLSQLTTLRYSTYRQSADPGKNLAIALQLNVDFDLSDNATGYQGRLVFEPYQSNSGGVNEGEWQNWDTKAGKWWGTKTTVSKNGVSTANPCVQSAPCTWAQLSAAFPNLGIHTTYGAVVLKAGSGWASFRGNVDNLTIGIDGVNTTYDFELVAPHPIVPASPPESISTALRDSLEAPSNLLDNAPGIRGKWIRNALLVAFKPSATQAERQSAIDAIGGTVVGGLALGAPEHYYIVRIPYALAPGDSTSGPVLRAKATLKSMSVIDAATLVPMDEPVSNYRRPNDGADPGVWKISRDSLSGRNWAQVAVNAPNAWGCTTGTFSGEPAAPIAIVDQGFHNLPDLTPNLGSRREFVADTDTLWHGTSVAGVLAAVGNNNRDLTGMLWRAGVNLYDRDGPIPGIFGKTKWLRHIDRAIKDGARVVNISMGLNPAQYTNGNPSTAADAARLEEWKEQIRRTMESSRDSSGRLRTLFVNSAGDNAYEARWNGFPALLDDPRYRDNIISVAALQRASSSAVVLATNANYGQVDVAAPGVQVAAFAANGIVDVDGSSVAAPFVSGVAGLLLSFDPTLSADSLKLLIIQGATTNGRYVHDLSNHNYPVLDAYEALRAAAGRRGAPLCGNRMYWNQPTLNVLREQKDGSVIVDPLVSFPNSFASISRLYHNGRILDLVATNSNDVTSTYRYTYRANGLWDTTAVSPYDFPPDEQEALSNVPVLKSHDGDSTIVWLGDTANTQIGIVGTAAGSQPRYFPSVRGEFKGAAYAYQTSNLHFLTGNHRRPNNQVVTVTLWQLDTEVGIPHALTSFVIGSETAGMEPSEDGRTVKIVYSGPFPTYGNCYIEFRSTSDGSIQRSYVVSQETNSCGNSNGFISPFIAPVTRAARENSRVTMRAVRAH
jgi:hypothetical protein